MDRDSELFWPGSGMEKFGFGIDTLIRNTDMWSNSLEMLDFLDFKPLAGALHSMSQAREERLYQCCGTVTIYYGSGSDF